MKSHVISRLIFKRIGDGKKIGFYNLESKKFGSFSIESKNKELIIEDLHANTNNSDLEKLRSSLEDKYAKLLDSIINCEGTNPNFSDIQKRDFIKYFISQAFITKNNIKNNASILNKSMPLWLLFIEEIIKEHDEQFAIDLEKELLDSAIKSINSKFLKLIKNEGIYFDKVLILEKNFKPIVLKLKNNKPFYTDKIFRNLVFLNLDLENSFLQKKLSLEQIENERFADVALTFGPIDRYKMVFFVNKKRLREYGLSDSICDFEIIENNIIEDQLFEFNVAFNNSFIKIQKPEKFYFFHPEDQEWVLNFLGLKN